MTAKKIASHSDNSNDRITSMAKEVLRGISKKGIDCSAETLRGVMANEVINTAVSSSSNLIVLGTYGKVGLSTIWAGSVAQKIVSKTSLPILLVSVRRE